MRQFMPAATTVEDRMLRDDSDMPRGDPKRLSGTFDSMDTTAGPVNSQIAFCESPPISDQPAPHDRQMYLTFLRIPEPWPN